MTTTALPLTALPGVPGSLTPTRIDVAGDLVTISHLAVSDGDLASLLNRVDSAERAAVVQRAVAIGARGLITMGVGIDVNAIDERVRETLGRLTDDAERRLGIVLEDGRRTMTEAFDPDHRTSVMARVVGELGTLRDGFLGRIDPAATDSHTNLFLARLAEVIGPDGTLEQRIVAALDPSTEGSALGALARDVEARFTEMRDLIVHQRGIESGRSVEATRGTAQGLDFEDDVEALVRAWAATHGGCVVDRTGRTGGALGPQAFVGDFVVTMPDGRRIVVEAKNQAAIALGGKDGILAELDRAIANREADAAVCISRREAFPTEVGRFAVYGNRILAVDDGDGVMVAVAMQWARATVVALATGRDHRLDLATVTDRVASIRRLAESLRGARTTLTEIRKGVDGLSERLGELRSDLLDQVADVEREIAGG